MGLQKSSKLFNFYSFISCSRFSYSPRKGAFASPGDIHTYAGLGRAGFTGDGGQATAANLNSPSSVALMPRATSISRTGPTSASGRWTPPERYRLSRASAPGYSGDGGSAVLAKLKNPSGIAVDSAGDVFFADMGNSRVRKISASGMITTVAGPAPPVSPATAARLPLRP